MKSEDQSTEHQEIEKSKDLCLKLASDTKIFMASYLSAEGITHCEILSSILNSSFMLFMDTMNIYKDHLLGEDEVRIASFKIAWKHYAKSLNEFFDN